MACGTRSGPSPSGSSPLASVPVSTATSAQGPTTYPVTLTDDAGRSVLIDHDPQRIVSLAPSNTEIACAVGACDELVGVTDFDDYPPQIATVDKVVVGAQVDVEKVVAARPDLVLAAGNGVTPDAIIGQLADLGLTVLVVYPRSVAEIGDDIALVGRALDEGLAAAREVARIDDAVGTVTPRSPGPAGHACSTRSASSRGRSTPPAQARSSPDSDRSARAPRRTAGVRRRDAAPPGRGAPRPTGSW